MVNICTQLFNLAMNIVQCIFLVITHNFIIYCFLNIIFNLANNIFCAYLANKKYPYINDNPNSSLGIAEIKTLFTDVKGLLLTKIASTAFSGTDNIFISAFIGIRYVGILSNYTVFSGIVNSVMNKIFGAMTASIGNLIASGKEERIEGCYKKIIFFKHGTLWIFVSGYDGSSSRICNADLVKHRILSSPDYYIICHYRVISS